MRLYRNVRDLEKVLDERNFPSYNREKYDWEGEKEYLYEPMKLKFMDLIKKYNI